MHSEKIPKIVHQTYANQQDLSWEILQKNIILEELNPEYKFEYYDNDRMEDWMLKDVMDIQNDLFNDTEGHMNEFEFKPIINLDIPDNFDYRDPKLVQLLNDKFDWHFGGDK